MRQRGFASSIVKGCIMEKSYCCQKPRTLKVESQDFVTSKKNDFYNQHILRTEWKQHVPKYLMWWKTTMATIWCATKDSLRTWIAWNLQMKFLKPLHHDQGDHRLIKSSSTQTAFSANQKRKRRSRRKAIGQPRDCASLRRKGGNQF